MFKVMERGEGRQPCSLQGDRRGPVKGVSHVQGDGRGVKSVSHVQRDGRGVTDVSHVQGDGRVEERQPCTR